MKTVIIDDQNKIVESNEISEKRNDFKSDRTSDQIDQTSVPSHDEVMK